MIDVRALPQPRHLGAARASSLSGPWTRVSDSPLSIVSKDDDVVRNIDFIGVGALRLVKGLGLSGTCAGRGSDECLAGNVETALCNRITQDRVTEQTGSEIALLRAHEDGLGFDVDTARVLVPTPEASPATWKQGYVYAHDTIQDPTDPSRVLVFYNGRDGWAHARETIGVSRLTGDDLQRSSRTK